MAHIEVIRNRIWNNNKNAQPEQNDKTAREETVEFKGCSRIKFTTQNTLILINISTFVDKKLVILYNLQHNQKYEERSNFLFRNRSIVRGRMNVERKRPMDNVDRKLICYLAEDANVTTSSLVNKVNLSIPAINKRIAKLKDEGVIEKTTIITDSQKVGKPVMTFVMVALDQFMLSDQLMQIVASDPDILECYAVTGEFDYILKICAKDIDALENKLLHMKQQGIAKSQTLIALREYKFNPSVLPDIALE